MKLFKSIIFLFIIINVISCKPKETSAVNEIKGKLFIIGGGSRPSEMVDRIISESGLDKGGYGIVLPMSSIEPDSAVYYAKQQFIEKGITSLYGVNFIKDEKLTNAKLDSVRDAKLVYISGGDQSRFMNIVAGTPIEKAIHDAYTNGSLVAGTSAGAAVMSKNMITGDELKHPDYNSTFRTIEPDNIELKQGLGMLSANIIIDQHFVKRSRYNRLITAIIQFPEITGIGIDESTAILVSNDKIEVVGDSQVIVFTNPEHSVKNQNNKYKASGLEMNIYLSGDVFYLK